MNDTAQIMGAISVLSGAGAELVQLRQAVAALEQRVSAQQGEIDALRRDGRAHGRGTEGRRAGRGRGTDQQ